MIIRVMDYHLVLTLSLGLMHSLASGSGVDGDLSLHDESIVIEFSNVFSYEISKIS